MNAASSVATHTHHMPFFMFHIVLMFKLIKLVESYESAVKLLNIVGVWTVG